jgi:hypothetical protein
MIYRKKNLFVEVGIFTVREIFLKIIRDNELLQGVINHPDLIFNFFVTSLHLSDYLASHKGTNISNIHAEIEKIDPNNIWRILYYLGNGLKHKRLTHESHSKTVGEGYELVRKKLLLDGNDLLDGTRQMSGNDYYIKFQNDEIHISIFAKSVVELWKRYFQDCHTDFGLSKQEIKF